MSNAAVLQWTIPDIQLSREPDCSCQQLEFGPSHVACPRDFCRRCGADLRVARLLVTSVSWADLWRLQLCETLAEPMRVLDATPNRAWLLAWMLLYYRDDGGMYSPQLSRRRDRITLNGTEFWLARVPKRPRNT